MCSSAALEAGAPRPPLLRSDEHALDQLRTRPYLYGAAVPMPLGFNAFGQASCQGGAAAPHVPAPRSALRSHPCVAIPSAEVMFSINLLPSSLGAMFAGSGSGTV